MPRRTLSLQASLNVGGLIWLQPSCSHCSTSCTLPSVFPPPPHLCPTFHHTPPRFSDPVRPSLHHHCHLVWLCHCPHLLRACRGPPIHSDFKHRIHLNKPHYRTSAASSHLPFTLLHLTFHFHFILLFHILIIEPESGSEQTSVRFHRTLTQPYILIYIL